MSKSRRVLLLILVLVSSLSITFLTLLKTSSQSKPAFKPTRCTSSVILGGCGDTNDPVIQGDAKGYPFKYYFEPQPSPDFEYSLNISWNYSYFALNWLIYAALVGSLTLLAVSISRAK
jgi:hypothetical protein